MLLYDKLYLNLIHIFCTLLTLHLILPTHIHYQIYPLQYCFYNFLIEPCSHDVFQKSVPKYVHVLDSCLFPFLPFVKHFVELIRCIFIVEFHRFTFCAICYFPIIFRFIFNLTASLSSHMCHHNRPKNDNLHFPSHKNYIHSHTKTKSGNGIHCNIWDPLEFLHIHSLADILNDIFHPHGIHLFPTDDHNIPYRYYFPASWFHFLCCFPVLYFRFQNHLLVLFHPFLQVGFELPPIAFLPQLFLILHHFLPNPASRMTVNVPDNIHHSNLQAVRSILSELPLIALPVPVPDISPLLTQSIQP